MTYKLFENAKGYEGRLKKLLKLEREAGNTIISIEHKGDILTRCQTIITVENKGGKKYHAEINVPEVQVPVDTANRKPKSVPDVQAIPEKRSAEKSKQEGTKLGSRGHAGSVHPAGKPDGEGARIIRNVCCEGKIGRGGMRQGNPDIQQYRQPKIREGKTKTLNMTLPPELFEAVLSGEKRMLCTKHNPRKDRYFRENAPGFVRIKNAGRVIRCKISMNVVTAEEIQIYIDKIIETSGCPCKHPPDRLYAWNGRDAKGPFTCVVCCRCGDVLKGNAAHFDPHNPF